MSRSTFYSCLNGKRFIKPSELHAFSQVLKVPIRRIKQEDIQHDLKELWRLFDVITDPKKAQSGEKPDRKRALDLAQKLARVAIGATERSRALNDLGRAYYFLQRFDEAHEAWLQAYPFAVKCVEKYGDDLYFNHVVRNLTISYTIRREFSNALLLLDSAEPIFHQDNEKIGMLHFTRAMIETHKGNVAEAKAQAHLSLDAYRLTGNNRWIGKAEITAAHYEYITGNYAKASELLASAINNLKESPFDSVTARNELIKALLKMKEHSKAITLIQETLAIHKETLQEYPAYKSRLDILLSMATGEFIHAERVLLDVNALEGLRIIAYKLLRKLTVNDDDALRLMQYSKIVEELEVHSSDLLDGEVL